MSEFSPTTDYLFCFNCPEESLDDTVLVLRDSNIQINKNKKHISLTFEEGVETSGVSVEGFCKGNLLNKTIKPHLETIQRENLVVLFTTPISQLEPYSFDQYFNENQSYTIEADSSS